MQRVVWIPKTKRQARNMSKVMHNLTIKQVSEIMDIPPYTLRFWEKEFQDILTPSRTNGGQRRYNEKDISVIKNIKLLKEQGIQLSRIKEKLGNKENNPNLDRIDLFAQRMGEMVRHEVSDFLKRSEK
jgi:DNA-binding transcriptional MerR regulator